MEILGGSIAIIGCVISLIFSIVLLIKAFHEGILWGLGYLLIPLVSLIFIIVHWDKAKDPFLKMLCGTALMIGGVLLANVGGN